MLAASLVLLALTGAAEAQRRAQPRPPARPAPAVTVHGHVFIGGYFYDPFYGPYPWWHRTAYPYWYFPVYDSHAEVRLSIEPKAAKLAAVYVDGFYAGVVDDFNGVFQSLPLTPGGHAIVLYLEGYRTVRHNIYLQPGSTFRLRETLLRLPPDVASEPPELAPPLPPPPAGTYRPPVTPSRVPPPPSGEYTPAVAAGFGTLDLRVQPRDAEVVIDGQRWASSDEGHFMVQVPAGSHRIEVSHPGYRRFTSEIEISDGDTSPLNVSLMTGAQ